MKEIIQAYAEAQKQGKVSALATNGIIINLLQLIQAGFISMLIFLHITII